MQCVLGACVRSSWSARWARLWDGACICAECVRVRAVRACGERAGESERACVGEIVRVRRNGEYPSAAVGYEMRYGPWIVYNHRAPALTPRVTRRASPRHVTSAPTEHHSGHPYTCRLDDPCKWLRRSTLPITEYYVRHMEWVFTESNGEFTERNQRQGGRGFDLDIRRRRRRIRPLRLFCANWPPSRLPYTCSLA